MKNEGSKQPGPCDQTSSNQVGNPSKKGLRVLGDIVRRGIGMRGAPERLRRLFGSDTSASARRSVDNMSRTMYGLPAIIQYQLLLLKMGDTSIRLWSLRSILIQSD